jgi:hypothetical protein
LGGLINAAGRQLAEWIFANAIKASYPSFPRRRESSELRFAF